MPADLQTIENMLWLLKNNPVEVLPTFVTLFPIAILIYRMSYLKKGVRYIFVFLVVKFVVEMYMLYLASINQNNLYLSNMLILVGYLLIARGFYEVYELGMTKQIAKWTLVFFVLMCMFDIFRDGMMNSFRYSGTLKCLFVMSLCVAFFYEMMTTLRVLYIIKYPMFWVAASLLIYFAPLTFMAPLEYYIDVRPLNNNMYLFIIIPYILESFYLFILGVGLYLED